MKQKQYNYTLAARSWNAKYKHEYKAGHSPRRQTVDRYMTSSKRLSVTVSFEPGMEKTRFLKKKF